MNSGLEKASRVVAWISVGFGLLGMIVGAVIFWAGPGLFLALQALPYARKSKD